jgi:hypothetical protein
MKKHPQIKIESVSMDSAYDDYKNYNFAVREAHIAPIIALNQRTSVNMQSLHSLNLAPDGSFHCKGNFKMVYYGFDKKRSRLKYRCPAALGKCECSLRWKCSRSAYGRIIYLKPDDDYRLIGPIPRGTTLWEKKFDKRTSVERAYSEEKGSHKLNDVRVRSLSKVKIHVYLSLCAHILKRIGSAISQGLVKPEPAAYPLSI